MHVVQDGRLCHHGVTTRDVKHILTMWKHEELEKYCRDRDLVFRYRRLVFRARPCARSTGHTYFLEKKKI